MINKFEFEKLLHDLKRAGKALSLICEETNVEKRTLIADLVKDELDRLYRDIEEMKNTKQGE